MILDLPPQLETIIEETAKIHGISAEDLTLQILQHKLQPSYTKGDFNYDLKRMKDMMDCEFRPMPDFASDDEFLAWVNA